MRGEQLPSVSTRGSGDAPVQTDLRARLDLVPRRRLARVIAASIARARADAARSKRSTRAASAA
jgi:hypothetical protein